MRVFLSYSTPDRSTADQIRIALTDRRPDLDIYFAPQRNDVGAYWMARLERELGQADAVLLLLGQRTGPWQELEYYDALRRNRGSGRPLIAPLLLSDTVPGLPFLDQFHRLSLTDRGFEDLIGLTLQALDGLQVGDATPAWRVVNPYRGLRAMTTENAAFFFGRESLTATILTRIASQPGCVPALIGNSGVGKSSVAMAGVLAALKSRLWPAGTEHAWPAALERSHTWPVVMVRPGERPLKALAQSCARLWLHSPAEIEEEALRWQRLLMGDSSLSALVEALRVQLAARVGAEAPERVVLYVDQCEELYSRADRDEAQRFSMLLAQAMDERKPPLIAMLSLRADYYGRFQQDAALFAVAQTIDVAPLDRAGIERVIRLPAERLGVRFDPPEVIEHIVESAAREPGSLPMLSDLLADTWRDMAHDAASAGVLRFPYQIIDISRPLSDKAERFLARHAAQEDTLRRLFVLKLALVAKEGDIFRRRARRSECSDAEWALVEAMADRDWRLLTTSDDGGEAVAEVAHEALLRYWPRAARWLDDSREFLIWRAQFDTECRAWQQSKEADRERALLTGLRLDKAVRWQSERGDDLSDRENAFIDASARATAHRLAQEQRAAQRLARQRAWIQRISFGALVVVAVVAVAAVLQTQKAQHAEVTANAEREKAIQARNEAERQARLADARRLATAAEQVLDGNAGEISLAGLLAIESLKRSATPEGKRVLRRVLSLTPAEFGSIASPWLWSNIQYSPDGSLVAHSRSLGRDVPASGQIAVVDAGAWQTRAIHDEDGRVWPLLSPDGRWLALAGYGRRLRVFERDSQRPALDVVQDDMFDAAFDAHGRVLYVARTDGVIEVREAPDWHLARRLSYPREGGRLLSVRIDLQPDGTRLLLHGQSARSGTLNPWLIPVAGGTPRALGKKRALHARFGPGADTLATVSSENDVTVWDASSGAAKHVLAFDTEVTGIEFTPDGSAIFVATRDGRVALMDVASRQIIREFAHTDWVNDIAVSPDGGLLATASDDRSAALWDVETGHRRWAAAHGDEVWRVAFGPGFGTLLTGGKDGALRVLDVATGEELERLRFDGGVLHIAYHPASDALALAVQGSNHDQSWTDVRLTDRASGAEVARFAHNGGFSSMIFSPDGDTLATTSVWSGELKLWDTSTGALRLQPGISPSEGELFFSHDGKRLIVGQFRRATSILDASTGRRIAAIGEPAGVDVVKLAPDARTLATFGPDGSSRGWDALTGTALWARERNQPSISGIVASGDGKRFAGRSADGRTIAVAETRTGRRVAGIPLDDRADYLLSDDGDRLLLTRTRLKDAERAERWYSELELWRVDGAERVFRRRFEHASVKAQALPGGRVAVLAMRTIRGEPAGFVEVVDARTGASLWTAPVDSGFIESQRVSGRDDVFLVAGAGVGQLRDIATGRVIFEAPGAGERAAAALGDRGLIAFGFDPSLRSGDDAVEIRNIVTGRLEKRFGDLGTIRDIAVSSDGKLLLAAVDSEEARHGVWMWRTDDWSSAGFIESGHYPHTIVPLADPDLLAIHDAGDSLRIVHIPSGREIRRFWHTLTADGAAVAAEADRAVSWLGNALRVWNTRDGTQTSHRVVHGGVAKLAVSPDGRIIAYLTDRPRASRRGGNFDALVLWEPEGDGAPTLLPMKEPTDLRFDPTGRFLAVGQGDTAVHLLDVATLRTTSTIDARPGGKLGEGAFSDDGTLFFAAESKERKNALRVFRVDSGTEIARIDAHTNRATPSRAAAVATRDTAGRWRASNALSAGTDDLLWRIAASKIHFDREAGRFVARLDSMESPGYRALLNQSVTVSPVVDGRPLNIWAIDADDGRVAALSDAGVTINSVQDGRQLAAWPGVELRGAGIGIGPQLRPLRRILFADGGDALLAYDTDNFGSAQMASRLWFWRWQTQPPRLISAQAPINGVAVSPAGTLFATAEGYRVEDERTRASIPVGDAQVRIWSAKSGAELQRIAMDDDVDAVAFSPDGSHLAARTSKHVAVFKVDDGSEVARFAFAGRRTSAGSVGFASGGRRVVAEAAGGVQVWSLEDEEPLLLRHGSDWAYYRTSADGRLIASLSTTRLRVWNVESGAALFALDFPRRKYQDVAFVGPDDALVAKTDAGLERILWHEDRLIAEACRRLARDIAEGEWERFFPDEPRRDICTAAASADSGAAPH